jgi:hypothetical protein
MRSPKREFPSSCPLVSTELAAGAGALPAPRRLKARLFESKRCLNAAHSLRLKGEEFGWVLTSERPHPAHFAREPVSKLNGVTRELDRSIIG